MRNYELLFIIRPNLDEEVNEAVINKCTAIIESQGGEVIKLDKWGKRRLAYDIQKLHEGFYVLINFKGVAAVAHELERILKINDDVIRQMIIRQEEE